MASSVVTSRVKEPGRQMADAIIRGSGTTPAAVISALYEWIVEAGKVPEECMRRIKPKNDQYLDEFLEALYERLFE